LTNFPNGKQTEESLKSGFPESEFRETNMVLIYKQELPAFLRKTKRSKYCSKPQYFESLILHSKLLFPFSFVNYKCDPS
jgi:hypothetical protein